ncbi:hypothetical protein [Spiroplasma endosymbiont of Othius punctulatus]|uniref:hypothetical protein n=1 Tax=Spiroplasma endosymbiont of Othius punctulatus TaxID=3066289 RepID=UPI0030D5320E
MKNLKQIIIKIDTSINDKDKIVINNKLGNFEEIYFEVKEYFSQKYISGSVQENEAKKNI